MKRKFVVATLAVVTGALSSVAAAVTVLSSEPLKGGPGGLVCSCTNLTSEPIVVDFVLLPSNGGSADTGH